MIKILMSDFAERKMIELLSFVFPGAELNGYAPVRHFIVSSQILTRPHFNHQHYRKQFESARLVQCHLDPQYQLAMELGLSFKDFDKLKNGHYKTYIISGDSQYHTTQLRLVFYSCL